MLTLFARIRGLSLRSVDNLIDQEIEKLADFVDLTQYLDRSKLHKLKSINLILCDLTGRVDSIPGETRGS